MSDFDEPVTSRRRPSAKPFDQLMNQLFGGMFGGWAG